MLRKLIVFLLLVLFASPSVAAADFYDQLYSQGMSAVQSGAYDTAIAKLRVAAFGLLDDVGRFESAQAYIVAAARHLNREQDERAALQKILQAERVERRYAKLDLPAAIREDVDAAAKALLTPEQLSLLKR